LKSWPKEMEMSQGLLALAGLLTAFVWFWPAELPVA
jgi:hypothetical protein